MHAFDDAHWALGVAVAFALLALAQLLVVVGRRHLAGWARAFLGLPDVTPLNDHMVAEMQRRMDLTRPSLALTGQ